MKFIHNMPGGGLLHIAKKYVEDAVSDKARGDRYGRCPDCHLPGCWVNLKERYWRVCMADKKRWWIGEAVTDEWRKGNYEDWARNEKILDSCEEVKPYRRRYRLRKLPRRLKSQWLKSRNPPAPSSSAHSSPGVFQEEPPF
jgi:hypothetical protein